MDLAAINSPGSAFIAGLITSLHCAAMCGPLSCTLLTSREERSDETTVISVYHVSRLFGYALLGGIAGAVGRIPLQWIPSPLLQGLPWLLVFFFLAVAFRWDRHLPKIALLSRFSLRLHSWTRRKSRVKAAAALGLGTPLLPCGPLYFVLALGSLSGSWFRGAELMLAFGLGTIPLLWITQTNFRWLQSILSPRWMGRLRVTLGLTAAAIVAWRLRASLGFDGPTLLNFVCS